MLFQRILTVVLAAPLLIGAILCPTPVVFKAVVTLCIGIGLHEFYLLAGFSRSERLFLILLGSLHAGFLLFCPERDSHLLFEGALLILVIFSGAIFFPGDVSGTAQKIGFSLLGVLYIGTFGAFVGLTRDLSHGVFWVFTLLAMTWLNDTTAYFVGHRWGKRRLAPRVSPGKTVEGFWGGFVGSLAGFLLFWVLSSRPIPFYHGLLLTLLVGFFGPLGDLSESLLKRSFGVKDSGNIIPGHGGMLDRIDALLFAAPVVYFYATLL